MKDFINPSRDIDVQGLLNIVKAAEECPEKNFDMRTWRDKFESCGSVGCLIGTYCIKYPEDALQLKEDQISPVYYYHPGVFTEILAVSKRFRITYVEANFLFYILPIHYDSKSAITLNQQQAIARLRKFIYYKMRKSELLENYEQARRISNLNIQELIHA